MRKRLGYTLMGIAIFHQLVGLFFYSDALQDIVQAGLFNTILPPYWERDAAFWFLMFGMTIFMLGWLTQWMQDHLGTIPRFFSISLLVLSLMGVFMMPASGLWLLIPVSLWMMRLPQANLYAIKLA